MKFRERIASVFQKLLANHFLSQDGYKIHTCMHFKVIEKVLTIRSLAVDCFTSHCIK